MEKIVTTKEELKEAIKNKEKTIIIDNEELSRSVLKFKKIKKFSKWTLGLLLAGTAVGSVGLCLAPATGGSSAVIGGATAGLVYSLTTASGATISTGAIIAIGALSILGCAVLFALWKDYEVEIQGGGSQSLGIKGEKLGGRFKVKLFHAK